MTPTIVDKEGKDKAVDVIDKSAFDFRPLGMGQQEWVDILSSPGIWQTLYLAVYAAAPVWAVWKFVRAARRIHKGSWPAAVSTGLAASAVALGAFLLLVR